MDINFERTACFNGHRPNRMFGFDYRNEGNVRIIKEIKSSIVRLIERNGINSFITGMALGVDIWSARVILMLKKEYPKLKLICAIPCKNQHKKWNEEDRNVYEEIIKRADYVHYVSDKEYDNSCMFARSRWMVDNSRFVISVWDGMKSGGTYNTLKYAEGRQRTLINIKVHQ